MESLLTADDFNHPGWTPPTSWFLSRAFGRELGHLLPENPQVLDQSKEYIDDALKTGKYSCSPKYLREWRELLDRGMPEVVAVLVSPDDNASQVLRSCAPPPIRRLMSQERRAEIINQVGRELRELRDKV